MNASVVAKHYHKLTPEERFKLILAASSRGDVAERERLVHAGQTIGLRMSDHSPYAQAFAEVGQRIYLVLIEDAARFNDALVHYGDCEANPVDDGEVDEEAETTADEDESGAPCSADRDPEIQETPNSPPKERATEREAALRPTRQRYLDLALGAGYVLRTEMEGWKLFCEQLTVPPFVLWDGLPGFERLQTALKWTEELAFTAEEFLHWVNRIRPAEQPELIKSPLTAKGFANAAEEGFRDRVRWWSG